MGSIYKLCHGSNLIGHEFKSQFLSLFFCRSLNDHPNVPIFTGMRPKKTSQVEMLSSAVSEMAKAMSGSPTLNSVGNAQAHTLIPANPSIGISPGKTASLRSNYLQQMRELYFLLESGALTDVEFSEQKCTILKDLKKLSS